MDGTNQLAGKLWAVERMVEEEPQGRDNAVHGRRRYARFLLLDLEPPHILRSRGMGRASQPRREPPDVTQIVALGLMAEPAHGHVVAQPLVIALLAVPILIQVYFNAGLAYWLSRRFGVAWCVAAPAALIGASNFFELAVAAAISLFGLQSGAALATVVGVLVEVPVMLSVVAIVKRTRGWYERPSSTVSA